MSKTAHDTKKTQTDSAATSLQNSPATIGGKAAALAKLDELGCPVPPWFAIPAAICATAFEDQDIVIARNRALEAMEQDDLATASTLLRDAILKVAFDDDFRDWVVAEYIKLGSELVAVRSSAIGEDGTDTSFAGQFDSVLGVQGEAALLDAIRTCWASAFGERVLAYRKRHEMDPLDSTMGVVVQTMIASEVSGVLFTANPIDGDPYTMVVSSTWGLGEALVSGLANADNYRIDRRSLANDALIVDREILEKDICIVLTEGGGTEEQDVPADRANVSTLDDDQLRALAEFGESLEESLGCPQDIEWAVADGTLYILQSRPITTRIRPRGMRRVWDNSNIVESYSGVVSPLTFSFARDAYDGVYAQMLFLLRVPKNLEKAATIATRQMLGYLDGRVYYNLRSWYYLLSLVPGYDSNAGAMEQMMGVRQKIDDEMAPKASASRAIRVKLGMLWCFATIRWRIKSFRKNLYSTLETYDVDFNKFDADQLVDAYDELRANLLYNWQAPLINDFRVMVLFDRLRLQITAWEMDDSGTLQNDLLCGQGNVESAEPTYMLLKMAERIRIAGKLREVVLETPDDELIDAIDRYGGADARATLEDLEIYLKRFGDRCANELKLETPTLRESPAFLYSVLRNFIRQDDLTYASLTANEQRIRSTAEAVVRERLAKKSFSRTRRRLFNLLLNHARKAVADREALRFDRTRVFGLVRRIFTALGDRLHESGMIEHPRDVFFLEVEEVIGSIQGNATTANLAGLIAVRKAEAEARSEDEMPDRINTIGIVGANPFEDAYAAVDISEDALSGIGCCPGIVEKAARVVHTPASGVSLDGDIMVCRRTDPGWVPLFPSCGGLLVERGSLLSHSAIVAREFGIPAIVGIPGLMDWAREGEMLSMDGSTGIVQRVENDAPSEDAQ